MSNTFQIAPVGLNTQDRLVVNTATKLLSYDGVAYQVFEGAPARAHLLILDDDTVEGRLALKQSRPGQVKLVVSSKPASAKNTIGMPRPVELGVLKSILKKLYATLQSQLVAQQRNDSNESISGLNETLTKSLFNILLEAKSQKQVMRLQTKTIPDIFIDGRNHCLATTASEHEIKQLMVMPVDDVALTSMNPDSFAVHSNEMSIQSLYNLLWLAGIKCSHGKLLPGHQRDKPFRLRAWPNFTRNSFIAEHLKLAAVLARQSLTLTQLAEQTQVALPEVINFYNAAYAVDLIEVISATDVVAAPASPRHHDRQGLLAKIAHRLNLKNMF